MTAYYNEIDPYAAQWLRNLIAAGHIAPGDVDERSIVDVQPADLDGYAQCHFFAGIGGWSLSLRIAGWPDDRPVWTGSCPCQPFSVAGAQKGFADKRHLWPEFKRLIEIRRPTVVYGEQVASATDWLRLVRSDLEDMDYAVGAMPVQAASAGADHLRDRFWFVADADFAGSQGRQALPECAGERASGPHGLAHADGFGGQIDTNAGGREDGGCAGQEPGPSGARHGDVANRDELGSGAERSERGGEFGRPSGNPEARPVGHGASQSEREPHDQGDALADGREARAVFGCAGDHLEWVIGADGKARRVKPGIRLLAHGVPARVGKLRAFGNAIDPRQAAEFIASTPAFERISARSAA